MDEEFQPEAAAPRVMRTGPGKKADKVKSPKAEKATGKKNTTWDPFRFGGAGATGEEAKNLERGPKSPKPGTAADEDLQVQFLTHCIKRLRFISAFWVVNILEK